MPRIFVGNFDFEHELAASSSGAGVFDRLLNDRPSDRSWVWTAIAERDDIVVSAAKIDPAEFRALAGRGAPIPQFCDSAEALPSGNDWQLVPWGWTDSLVEWADKRGWSCAAPPTDIVRRVNSRELRFGLERDWDIALGGAALVRSLEELDAAIAQSGELQLGWLLKANYGMSGREAMRGRGTKLEGNLRNWARKRFAQSGPIVFEPIVERMAEAGIQVEIPHAGAPQLVGITPLVTDRAGVYRGSRFGCPAQEIACWQPAVEVGLRTALELQRLGYFGLLGIDSMQYRDALGETRLRPLQDLNARYTMGRLALGFCRVLPGQKGIGGATGSTSTSPPPPPPCEGGETLNNALGEHTDLSRPAGMSGWCGSWLHFNDRMLCGRAPGEWLDSLKPALPKEVLVVPASPQAPGSAVSRAILVLAPSPAIRRLTETAVIEALGIRAGGAAM